MEELVFNSKGKDVTTSVIVAKAFEKAHKNVLRDIEALTCSQEFRRLNFELTSYADAQGKPRPMYNLTKDGFSFLVMGYVGDRASEFKERFINEFNKRESLLKNDDFIINRALSILSERTKQLEEKVKIDAPKVEYYENVLASNSTITTTLVAKELGMSAQELNKRLREIQVIYKSGETWVPYAQYQNMNYARIRTSTYTDSKGATHTSHLLVWTEQGRAFIHSIFNKKF